MNQERVIQQLQAAVSLHNQGEFDQAEAIYRQVLSVDENNFYALRFLGCLCRITGSFDEGISFLRKAVDQRPNIDVFITSLIFIWTAGIIQKL